MEELWEAVYARLVGSQALLALIGGAEHVQRAYQPKRSELPAVTYREEAQHRVVQGTAAVRNVIFVTTSWGERDLVCAQAGEECVAALENAPLSTENLHGYWCRWMGHRGAPRYDEKLGCYYQEFAFRACVRTKS